MPENKRFVVVGLGNFGISAAEALYRRGHDVLGLDLTKANVERAAPFLAQGIAGDGRRVDTLEILGAKGSDAGIVSTGDDVAASMLATLALRDLEVDEIYVKVISRDHARVMTRLGVTEVVFPEREAALALGVRLSSGSIVNYTNLGADFAIQEMVVPLEWEGRALSELDPRAKFRVSIIAVRDVLTDRVQAPPDADRPLRQSDTILVAGRVDDLYRLAHA